MAVPRHRIGVDWDNDRFICYDTVVGDPLNVINNTLSTDPSFVALHWNYMNVSAINSSTVSVQQEFTDYGIRKLHCVTGTNTTAGAHFGYDGSGAADIVVSNGVARRAVMWIKATVGSGTSMKLEMINGGASSTTFTISTSWQRVTLFYTTTSTTTGFKITKNTSATDVTFDATGFMITSGATPNGFNVGHATNRYDVISSDVKAFNIKMGKTNWTAHIPAEGTANLTLDNQSRTYSPEYTSSPLYGNMEDKRKITVDVYRESSAAWIRIFTGWTRNFSPDYGQNRANECELTCEQGMFRLDENPFRSDVSSDTTADAVFTKIANTVYQSAASPYQVVCNQSTFNASYFSDPTTITDFDAGVSELTLTGEDWGGDIQATRTLKDILKVERGLWFINRAGVIVFYNRTHYVDPATAPSATAISLDSQAVDGKYINGQNYYNVVRVNYKPSDSNANQVVWRSRSRGLLVNPYKKGIRSEVKFEYEEGKKMTVSAVNPFDGTANASTFVANTPSGLDVSQYFAVNLDQPENGIAQLIMNNYGPYQARLTVELKGTIKESYGGETAIATREDGLQGGKYEHAESVKVLNDQDDAQNLADHLLDVHGETFGQFTSMQIASRNDTWTARILDTEMGDLLTLSEYQTGHSGDYIVIGESYRWTPGLLEASFYLHPEFRTRKYWILGTSLLGSETYLGY